MKTAVIFFAVIICSTFVTARLGSRNLATSYTTQDFNEFTRGLWDSLALAHEYEDFQNCIHQQAPAGILLIKAIASLDQFTQNDVIVGLKRLGKVFNVIIAALKQCDSKEMYWGTFSEIVGNFTQPASMSLTQGSSFTIDGVEVYSDIVRAVTACSNSQMATCGDAIGDAMGKVYYGQVDPTSPETIAKINSIPNLTWTAGVNPDFQRMNLWQFKKQRVSLRHMHSKKKNKTSSTTSDDTTGRGRQLQSMPAGFDTRTKWPYCIHAIQDQGPCASCWAVASAEVLSDRFCIASNRSINTVLGPQYMVSCDTSNKGCNGGYLKNVWNFLETYGDVTETCFPYTSANFVIPTCSSFTRCQDNTVMRKYYAKKGSSRSFSGVAAMQQEIYANGPIVAAMFVYSDFMSYTSGIYKQAWGSYIGGHAIKIIGWGTENGVGYWIISNSWGKSWGETGHARIAFGQVGMENQGYAGLADLIRK